MKGNGGPAGGVFPAATSADSHFAHVVVHPLQLALVVLFHLAIGANTALALGQLTLCGGGLWWWYIAVCGGGGDVVVAMRQWWFN